MKSFATLSTLAIALGSTFAAPLSSDAAALQAAYKRQTTCGTWSAITRNVGDGDPHQNYLDKQLSQPIGCGSAPSCSVGHAEYQSWTIGFTSSGGYDSWISGGFDVQKSWETGNDYTCYGSTGDTVCVWQRIAHTAYTVQDGSFNACTNEFHPNGDPYVLKSPNTNNAGGEYYCVLGTCRSAGEEYWE